MKKILAILMFISTSHCISIPSNEIINNQKTRNLEIYHTRHHVWDANKKNIVGFRNPYPAPPRENGKAFFWIVNKILTGKEKEKIFPADFVKIEKEEIQNKVNAYRFWWLFYSIYSRSQI